MKKEDTAYLRHILDAISRIEEYTKGIELIHDYLGVDMDAVWDTVGGDIPLLKNKLLYLIEKGWKI